MANRALTVSEITARVKSVLEDSFEMGWVIGEVSDFSRARSGHCYWTLRDESSQISCVMFRFYARELTFVPEPGVQLLVYGNVSVYERGGRYQLQVYWVQPVGVGEMAVAFERLRERLEAEGLFAKEHKKPLPRFPRCIGVVTSASGAAIQDILQIVQRRSPGVQIVLRPTQVQGPGAAEAIANGIADLNAHSDADLLIVGRGGGSPEDLWPFNEEVVARAIHDSNIPVVSAVGHEIDYTIADYAADLRAPTPSAAAELATPDQLEIRRQVAARTRELLRLIRDRLAVSEQRLEERDPELLLYALRGRLEQSEQGLDEMRALLAEALDRHLMKTGARFRTSVLRLKSTDPLAGLSRGFAYCSRDQSGQPVIRGGDLSPGDRLRLRFAEGEAGCLVEEVSPGRRFTTRTATGREGND